MDTVKCWRTKHSYLFHPADPQSQFAEHDLHTAISSDEMDSMALYRKPQFVLCGGMSGRVNVVVVHVCFLLEEKRK